MKNNGSGISREAWLILLLFVFLISDNNGQNSFQKIATPASSAGSGICLHYSEQQSNLLLAGITPGIISSPFAQVVDINGNALWTKKINGFQSQPNLVNAIDNLPHGPMFLSVPFFDAQGNTFRQTVVKISSSATLDWTAQIGAVHSFNYGANLLSTLGTGVSLAHLSNDYPPNISLSNLADDGSLNWSYTYVASNNSVSKPYCVQELANGTKIIGGSFSDLADSTLNSGTVLWIATTGEIINSTTYLNTVIASIDVFPNGDLLIAGSIKNEKDEGLFARLGTDGTMQWAKKIVIDGISSRCKAIATDDGGQIVFLKRMLSERDYGVIMKIDSQGNVSWQRRQHGVTDISDNLTGIVTGNQGYANISLKGDLRNTVLLKTDLDGDVEGCSLLETCAYLEDINLDPLALNWERKPFENSSVTLNLELENLDIEYFDHCEPAEIPVPDFLLPDTLCQDECIVLENLQQLTADLWEWSGTDIQFPMEQNPGNICFPVAGDSEVKHLIYFGGCVDSSLQTINILTTPDPALTPDTVICNTESLLLNVLVEDATFYQWENGHQLPEREILESGLYTVTINNGFCMAADSIQVSFIADLFNPEEFELGEDTTLCKENSQVFGVGPNIVDEFWWNDGYSESLRPIQQTGTYALTVSIEGCLFVDSIYISIKNCGEAIYVPTVFSPNGDEVNDYFSIYGPYHQVESFQIFNRWGGLVWEAKDSNQWDGTVNGQAAQTGVYVFLLRYTDLRTGESKWKGGEITLVR